MMKCPNCQDEFRVGIVSCPDCDLLLVSELSAAEDDAPPVEVVCVWHCTNSAVLPVAESLLLSEGISYALKNHGLQDLLGWARLGTGFNTVVGPAELWVAKADAVRARELLESLEQPSQATEPSEVGPESLLG